MRLLIERGWWVLMALGWIIMALVLMAKAVL